MKILKIPSTVLIFFILAFAGISACAEIVGRVLLAAGETVAVRDGSALPLAQGSAVGDKDTLRTGAASNLQVRFTDGSIMSLRENSELAIEEYHFSDGGDGLEKAFYRMVRGGLRTVTGLIGRRNHQNYSVGTPVATIGIRGTHYTLALCAGGSCANADGSKANDGLYGGVTDGIVAATTKRGEFGFGAGDTFFAPNIDSPVEKLIGPPIFLSDRLEGQKRKEGKQADSGGGGAGGEQSSSGGIQSDSRPNTTPLALPSLPFVITQNLGPQGGSTVLPPANANGWVVIYPLSNGVENAVFSDQNPATFNGSNQLLSYGSGGVFPSGALTGGTIVDSGSLTLSTGQVITWGRWTGGTVVVASSGATLTNVPLLFGAATGLLQNGSTLLPTGGVATYTFAGGPRPVDFSGNVGNVTSSTLTLDFTAQSALFNAGINFPSIGTFGSATFNVGGIGARQSGSNTGDFGGALSGSCTGGGCASSQVTGGFGVGTAGGSNNIEFAIVGGGFGPSLGGPVAFLNTYLSTGLFVQSLPLPSVGSGGIAYYPASFSSGFTVSQAQFTPTTGSAMGAFVATSPSSIQGSIGQAAVFDATSPSDAAAAAAGNLHWGRWLGTGATVNGAVFGGDGTNSNLHYIVGDVPTLPASGSVTYNPVGGTNPTNALGVTGSFLGGNVSVDFTARQLSVNNLKIGFNSATYIMNSGTPQSFQTNGSFAGGLSGSCSGATCGTSVSGAYAGSFTGTNAPGMAMVYHAFDSGRNGDIVGAQGFRR